ncbi:MAG: hypothetical protein IJW99_02535 [Clostridia bacterium]|nr:hypothetical protein [Clostridia bacterium]
MKRKYWLTGILLCIVACLFCACGKASTDGSETATSITTAAEMTSTVSEESTTGTVAVETAPPLTAADFPEIEASHEEWLRVGLDDYLNNTKRNFDAAAYFAENGYGVLALYNDWFTYDARSAKAVASLFFRYVMENYGYEALFDLDRRIEYKDAFLKSVSPELTYRNDPDAERILSGMTCDSNANYKYIIRLEGASYRFVHIDHEIALVHRMIYNNTVAVARLKEYIRSIEGYEKYFDLSRDLKYNVPLQGGVSSTNNNTKIMTVNDTYAMLHETVHAVSLYSNQEALWLSEGMADYLSKGHGFDDLVDQTHYLALFSVEQGLYDSYIAAGEPNALRYREIHRLYTERGGTFATPEEVDNLLYTDASAVAEFAMPHDERIGDVYESLNGKSYEGQGGELTYKQSASFVRYLIDRCGIGTVLAALNEYDRMEELFGASYDELYAAWRESIGA